MSEEQPKSPQVKEFKFKIYKEPMGWSVVWDADFNGEMPTGPFHVIEKSAYDATQTRWAETEFHLNAVIKERDAYKKAKQENDERFQLEIGALTAENARLKLTQRPFVHERLLKMTAERDRFKSVLEKIASKDRPYGEGGCHYREVQSIADEALEQVTQLSSPIGSSESE